MNHKVIELAHLRNQLALGVFTEMDNELLQKVNQNILKLDSPFKEIVVNAISNCKEDIAKGDFKSSTQEIQLIHNFPYGNFKAWNSNYFYSVELLSYFEQIQDVKKIKLLIGVLARLQEINS